MDIDNTQLIEDYLSGKSCRQLGLEYGRDAMSIYKRLVRNGVVLRNKWEGKTLNMPTAELSEFHRQVIDGCLLGDGSVFCKNSKSTAHFSLTTIHEAFGSHLSEILPLSFRVRKRCDKEREINGKLYKCKTSYDVVSSVDKSLNPYRQLWYPDGDKIVPKNLILSPTTVKYWFYGDGSTSFISYKNEKDAYVRITFCTNGFTIDDCELLLSKLNKVNLTFNIYLSRAKPMLVALKSSIVRDFFDYIGECAVPCFGYKWKLPSCSRK